MTYCASCSKMCGLDEPVVEEQDVTVSDGEVEVTYRVAIPCADCGTELRETEMTITMTFEHTCVPDPADADSEEEKEEDVPEINWASADVSLDAEPTDRFENHTPKGKFITNHRYMKHYYGVAVQGALVCPECGEEIEVSGSVEEQASSFDEV